MPCEAFVRAAFAGNLWYGTIRQGTTATVRLDGGFTKCETCRSWTNLCARIEVISDYSESTFAIYDLETVPADLMSELIPPNLQSFKVGALRKLYHRELKRTCVANSCICCGAPVRPDSISQMRDRMEPITQFNVQVSKRLADATSRLSAARWRVSGESPSGPARR